MFPFASNVYNNQIFFGGYPTKEWFAVLIENHVKIMVDLTSPDEKINCQLYDYSTKLPHQEMLYLHYAISDNKIPDNVEGFKEFIKLLGRHIYQFRTDEKMYIHCRGGHSRSGMVVAGLLCFLCNITPEKSLYITTVAHANREFLKPKWRYQKCPQLFSQRKFVIDVFKPILITSDIYENKISNNLISFLNDTDIRPLYEKKTSHTLSDVLICLRTLLISDKPVCTFEFFAKNKLLS